jgi:hypothetical protein
VAHLASIRSTQGIDSAFYIPVRVGIVDSFHLAQHRQVQLARRTLSAVGNLAAYVDAARFGQALALKLMAVAGTLFRPLPDAQTGEH